MALLLVALAGGAVYGYVRHTENAPGNYGLVCTPGPVPSTVRMSAAALGAVAGPTVDMLVGTGGTLDVSGLQEPASAWSDAPPSGDLSHVPGAARVDAGYEVRWWSRQIDHPGAAVFVFRNRNAAATYVRNAATSRCRHDATSYPVAQPAAGRGLVWDNPDGVLQADVFFSRGDHAYRVTVVTVGEKPTDVDDRQLVAVAQQLACQLRDAACPRSRSRTYNPAPAA